MPSSSFVVASVKKRSRGSPLAFLTIFSTIRTASRSACSTEKPVAFGWATDLCAQVTTQESTVRIFVLSSSFVTAQLLNSVENFTTMNEVREVLNGIVHKLESQSTLKVLKEARNEVKAVRDQLLKAHDEIGKARR